jgi:DNA-directed RNA polymerase specialized sigma24 family protein
MLEPVSCGGIVLRTRIGETPLAVPSFTEWVAAREHALLRFAFLVTGEAESADAELQRALTSIYQRWDEVARSDDPDIEVRCEVVGHLGSRWRRGRRRSRTVRLPSAAAWSPPTADAPSPDAQRLWRALAALTPRQRAALVLDATANDPAESAAIVGTDEGGWYELLRSARAALTAEVEDELLRRRDLPMLMRETVTSYGEQAPEPYELAERVVQRSRRRRRNQAVAGLVAIAALLIPVAWLANPPEPDRDRLLDPQPPEIPLSEVPEWRWESYGGIEVQVPATWGLGDLTQWCADSPPEDRITGPSVDRPVLDPVGPEPVVCSVSSGTGTRGVSRPTFTSGLLLRPPWAPARLGRADVAAQAEIFTRWIGGVELTVVDQRLEMARRILLSATIIEETDVNICEPTARVPRLGRYLSMRQAGVDTIVEAEAVSICRYQLSGWEEPTLYSSRRVGRPEAAELLRLIQGARSIEPPSADWPAGCMPADAILLRVWQGGQPTNVWLHHTACDVQGLDDGARVRELPPALLRLVLT